MMSLIERRKRDRSCVSGQSEFVQTWHDICDRSAKKEDRWIEKLIERGVKVAHPDDGWVDRKNHSVTLCYPHFDLGVKPGNLICLGYHFDRSRIVRAIKIENWFNMTKKIYFNPQVWCYIGKE